MITQSDVTLYLVTGTTVYFRCDSSSNEGVVNHADTTGLLVRLDNEVDETRFDWDESFTLEINGSEYTFND